MNNNIINKHKEIFMIFELLIDKIDKYFTYKNNITLNDNIYHLNLLNKIEKLYEDFEKHIAITNKKHIHKL